MQKRSILSLLLVAAITLFSVSVVSPQDDTIRIGALVKDTANPFFGTMLDGYEWAGERYGIDVVQGSVPVAGDVDGQLAVLEGWLNEGTFDGFIVTPIRATSLNSALATATEQGLPIINIDDLIPADALADSGIELSAQIASNNVRAGQFAAEFVIENVEAGAQVAVIEGIAANTSSIDRVAGFTETATAGGLDVVASQPADWDRAQAFNVASNILTGNPDVVAIFAANDQMGLGAVEAVEAAGLSDDVIVLSVDAIPEALAAVEEGRLAGTVAQFPDEMAVLAVEAMMKVIDGRPIAPEIESPVVLITQENIDGAGSQLGDPAIGELRFGGLVKDLANPFFQTMIDGYDMAAEALGVEVVTGSVPTPEDVDDQLAILEGWLNEGGFDAFSVTPIRATSLNSALATASEQGVPVINIDDLIPAEAIADSGLDISQQIASNNMRAGQFAAEYVLANVEAGAQVAILEGIAANTSSIDRVAGFNETATAGGLEVVASQPANWDRAEAFTVATNILQGNPDVVAIFAANDQMGLGVVEAVDAAGLSDQVIVVSVDAIPEALASVAEGRLAGTVAQFPDEMAFLAVESMIKVAEGRPVAPFMESPVVLYTIDNLPE